MDPSTMRGRRGIEWSRSAPASLAGWRLSIDKPSLIGAGHGAMANIVADEASVVWGVVYEISVEDFEHFELTEGVLIDHYRRTEAVEEPAGMVSLRSIFENSLRKHS